MHADNARVHAVCVRLGYEPDPEPFFDECVVTLADGRTRSVSEISNFLMKAIDASSSRM